VNEEKGNDEGLGDRFNMGGGRLLDKQENESIRDKVNICEPNNRTDE
jgi:hypothetical protein